MNTERELQRVAVCIVPRERHSLALKSLDSVTQNTGCPADVIYIDGNSPRHIADKLREACDSEGFSYIRVDRFLSPNEARNIALRNVDADYVAFIDNDVFCHPGWLAALMACAKETGATAVTPLILEGSEEFNAIHMAGGDFLEVRVGEFNRVRERHRRMLELLEDVEHQLVREQVGYFEFHCVLVRKTYFSEHSSLDEGFVSLLEHLDLAREIGRSGGTVFFEPTSIVRYDSASEFTADDRLFFEVRWSDEWNNRSIAHARSKWHLAPDDPGMARLSKWARRHREMSTVSPKNWKRRALPRVLRKKVGRWLRSHGLMRPASPR